MDHSTFNPVVLELHRAGREVPFHAFQPAALELIGALISIDFALWGNASASPLEIHRLYLFNCDDSILEACPSPKPMP